MASVALDPGRLRLALLVGLLASAQTISLADSWPLPEKQEYHSEDRSFRFTVEPRILSSASAYFREYEEKDNPGQAPGQRDHCLGSLERRDELGRYVEVWKRPLVNDVSPVWALVANRGDYVVTFDNWHAMGFGGDAVVIYGDGGALIREMSIVDFIPESHFERLPYSVSSIHWGGEHRFVEGGAVLLLQVASSDSPFEDEDIEFENVKIRLADGSLISHSAGLRTAPQPPN